MYEGTFQVRGWTNSRHLFDRNIRVLGRRLQLLEQLAQLQVLGLSLDLFESLVEGNGWQSTQALLRLL